MYRPKSEYYELPTKYNETVVRLLVQSPTRMFVYWEVAEQNHFCDNASKPVLKITNVTMNYCYEIEVDPFTNNYYIEVKDANCDYRVELGAKHKQQFESIFRSNDVKVPRGTPLASQESEEIIYRNCMKLTETDKFTIYYRNDRSRAFHTNLKQDYYSLSFDANDAFSSGELQSSGTFYAS